MTREVCSSAPLHKAAFRVIVSPQLGPHLFFITGKAVTSRSRSPQILMGWWSARSNDYRSPLVELANTTSSVKGSSNRKIRL
jgi:hypothetical protein